MNHSKIYTRFVLPDGNEVPLIFRSKTDLRKFESKYFTYRKTYEELFGFEEVKKMMRSAPIYSRALKKAGIS
ncbi:hypothetical protein D3P07_00555 [Paenibacillus sp. 1011MAR3C5]|uniref:hypothetical protein n=1 Tax=Paenibacillus sp. 1011MAR3C5 TaxID=1675787 RepID=UPI000E6B50F6|nr:hypothetical protein [Paenibacillus sp. 1011MAR3C5]RJE90634.1 hypothetical protein D3P07_00555 [Paenibacillus sp. 1011MAR3C5]